MGFLHISIAINPVITCIHRAFSVNCDFARQQICVLFDQVALRLCTVSSHPQFMRELRGQNFTLFQLRSFLGRCSAEPWQNCDLSVAQFLVERIHNRIATFLLRSFLDWCTNCWILTELRSFQLCLTAEPLTNYDCFSCAVPVLMHQLRNLDRIAIIPIVFEWGTSRNCDRCSPCRSTLQISLIMFGVLESQDSILRQSCGICPNPVGAHCKFLWSSWRAGDYIENLRKRRYAIRYSRYLCASAVAIRYFTISVRKRGCDTIFHGIPANL